MHFLFLEVIDLRNKRKIPDENKMNKRKKYMKDMEKLTAIQPQNITDPRGMKQGNGKTGNCGKLFEQIFVWNLPPVITCPGISEWCRNNCYNADERYEKFPISEWCENLWWVLNNKEALERRILSQLYECKNKRIAVRIHSSGDFFSKEYISFWSDIIRQNPEVHFWAYTRSWTMERLVEDIKKLNSLDNMKLLLSWDETMIQPPDELDKSIVVNSNEEIISIAKRKGGVICPEQYNLVSSCADCGLCICKSSGNIYFVVH